MYMFDFQFVKEIDNKNLNFNTDVSIVSRDGKSAINFTTDQECFDELVKWLFSNTTGRFVFLGTNKIYFENEEDALAFKIGWL